MRTGRVARSAESRDTTGSAAWNLPLGVAAKALIDSLRSDIVDAWNLVLVLACRVLVLFGLGVAVEVEIDHDVPLGFTVRKGAAQTEDLARQHPPDQTDGVAAFVICGDGNVDEFGGGVGVAESNDGDVDVGGFFDGLGVGAGVRYDDQAGLFERASNVVGEIAGCEATGNGDSTGVSGEFEDGTLTVWASGDDGDVGGVIDCCDDASC